MKNLISERVADFIKNFPPFNILDTKSLYLLAEQVVIVYKEKNSIIFTVDENQHSHFYLVHKGAVTLNNSTTNTIIDYCDEGDVFGLRPLIANENYKLEARAHEESILYGIPIDIFRPMAKQNEEVSVFLMESFASNTRNPYSKNQKGQLYGIEGEDDSKKEIKIPDLQLASYSKKLITCSPRTTIQKAAELMTLKHIGSVLVVSKGLAIGIITDKDLRNKVISGKQPITGTVKSIMSSPVITYPRKLTITQAQMAMMKSSISHLVITEDGTTNSKPLGILSKHDVMVSLGDNPAVLVKAIKRTQKIKKIKQLRKSVIVLLNGYLEQNIPLGLIAKIISELNDTCIKQVVEISLAKMKSPPPVKFAWLALGSQGRSEQLLHTDQDNALVFEDVPEEDLPKTTTYFLNLSKKITKGLNTIGYEYCPADMMASNPKWCLSLQEWKNKLSYWIGNPGPNEVLMSSIFFDYSLVFGERSLLDNMSEHIFRTVEKYPIFLVHLANGALQSPSPTGFFRQFVVEQDGQHKDFFDLKSRALRPLIDAARVLILSHSVKGISNTWERYEKLAELEPNNNELYLACSYATKALLKFRTRQGLFHHDSGRFIELEQLTKQEKMKLKRTFKVIKEIQELITLRFKVTNILG
jgi:CBS domain-containing protein